jgi:uncharacterized coiled-coil protein SlyX
MKELERMMGCVESVVGRKIKTVTEELSDAYANHPERISRLRQKLFDLVQKQKKLALHQAEMEKVSKS